MLKSLQQLNSRSGNAARKAVDAARDVPLITNISLLLGLLIIPTLSGVVLIA